MAERVQFVPGDMRLKLLGGDLAIEFERETQSSRALVSAVAKGGSSTLAELAPWG